MKSFIITVQDFFKMHQTVPNTGDFDQNKKSLLIPLYQREYRWSDDKIQSLLNDIKKNSKFLGNIILDECAKNYEIVDGQQRITTLVLVLIELYNYYLGHKRERDNILNHLKANNEWLLKNDSVGDFLVFEKDNIKILINDESDVYNQKADFERAFFTIKKIIEGWKNSTDVQDFKQKLFDCKLLVLINDEHQNTTPVEQLFLDINEKSQKLEVEDVFKGHCFGNFTTSQKELRDKWVELKKQSIAFNSFGYQNLSQYIYLYLLETVNPDIPQNLSENGKHFLDGKTMDETEQIIDGMVSFGKSVVEFSKNIKESDYYFYNLCKDFEKHKKSNDKTILKNLCKDMIAPAGKAVYQKTPLFFLVHCLNINDNLSNCILFEEFRKIITNLYIYMALFVFDGSKKSKKSMDHELYKALIDEGSIKKSITASQDLRKSKVDEFEFPIKFNNKKHYVLYTIMDYYCNNSNSLNFQYLKENEYTREHLIINDSNKIEWVHNDSKIEIDVPNLLAKNNKNLTINNIILDRELNKSLGHKDIITKIEKIKEWFNSPGRTCPRHVKRFIDYIEKMPSYQNLKKLTKTDNEDTIKKSYYSFLNDYFNDNNDLLSLLNNDFKDTFKQ